MNTGRLGLNGDFVLDTMISPFNNGFPLITSAVCSRLDLLMKTVNSGTKSFPKVVLWAVMGPAVVVVDVVEVVDEAIVVVVVVVTLPTTTGRRHRDGLHVLLVVTSETKALSKGLGVVGLLL